MCPRMSSDHACAKSSLDAGLGRQAREASGVTSALLLAYLDRVGGPDALGEVLRRCGLSDQEAELRDENCWFSWQTKIELFEATAQVLDNPDFLVDMATMALDMRVAGGLKVALRMLGSPSSCTAASCAPTRASTAATRWS